MTLGKYVCDKCGERRPSWNRLLQHKHYSCKKTPILAYYEFWWAGPAGYWKWHKKTKQLP